MLSKEEKKRPFLEKYSLKTWSLHGNAPNNMWWKWDGLSIAQRKETIFISTTCPFIWGSQSTTSVCLIVKNEKILRLFFVLDDSSPLIDIITFSAHLNLIKICFLIGNGQSILEKAEEILTPRKHSAKVTYEYFPSPQMYLLETSRCEKLN